MSWLLCYKEKDLQLLQETETDTTTVLVANHSTQTQDSNSGSSVSQPVSSSAISFGQSQSFPQQSFGPSQFGNALPSQAQLLPQQYYPQFRNSFRGRGRGPRPPCDICGGHYHSNNFCYSKPPQPFDYSSLQ